MDIFRNLNNEFMTSGDDFPLILGVDDNGDVYKVLKEGVAVYRGIMDSFKKLNDQFMTSGNDFSLILGVDDNGDGYKVLNERVVVYRGIMDGFMKLNDEFMTSGKDFALIVRVDDAGGGYKVLKEGVVVYRRIMDRITKLNDEFMSSGRDFALVVRVDDNGDGYKVLKEGGTGGSRMGLIKLRDEFMIGSEWGIKCASDGQSRYFGLEDIGSNLVTGGSKPTKKYFVDEYGWTYEREGRKGRVDLAIKNSDKKEITYKMLDVFIDLESTSIDVAGALKLEKRIFTIIRDSLDTEDSKYLPGDVTIYSLYSLDSDIMHSLIKNDVVVKEYYRRKAVCKPCKEFQEKINGSATSKPKLMEFALITDIAWNAWEMERGLKPDEVQLKPIMIVSDDHHISELANELATDGFTVIRTLPNGMRNESMYRQLTHDEISWIRNKRLHRI